MNTEGTTVLSQKLLLIISHVHTRMRTRAHARAYILIVFDFLSKNWQNSDHIEQQCLINYERK